MAEEIPKNLSPAEKIKLLKQLEEEKKKKAEDLEEEIEMLEEQIKKDEEIAVIEERQVNELMQKELEKLKFRLKDVDKSKVRKEEDQKSLEEEVASTQISEEAKNALNLDYKINVGNVASKGVYDRLVEIRNKAAGNQYLSHDDQKFLSSVENNLEKAYDTVKKYESYEDAVKKIKKEMYLVDQIKGYQG